MTETTDGRGTGRTRMPRRPLNPLAAGAALATSAVLLTGAAPAEAQVHAPIWSATLTVDRNTRLTTVGAGCHNGTGGLDDCSSTSVLTDDDFQWPAGTTRTVKNLHLLSLDSGSTFQLQFDPGAVLPTAVRTNGRLVLGGTTFAFSDSRWVTYPSSTTWHLSNSGLDWADGDTVAVSITMPLPAPTGADLGFTTTTTLSWTAVPNAAAYTPAPTYEFNWERQASGACPPPTGTWQNGGSGTSTSAAIIQPGQRTCAWVRAKAGTLAGPASAPAVMLAQPSVNAQPGNGEARLNWSSIVGARTYEYQQYKVQAQGRCTPTGFGNTWKPTGDGNRIYVTIYGLSNGTRYCFRVRARDRGVEGFPSSPVEATPVEKGLIIEPKRLTVIEGTTGRYTIRLDTRPAGNVRVVVILDAYGGCKNANFVQRIQGESNEESGGLSMTFTRDNWNVRRVVEIIAREDGPPDGCSTETNGETRVRNWPRSSHDPAYDYSDTNPAHDAHVTEYDNDIPGQGTGFFASANPVREGGQFQLTLLVPPSTTTLRVGASFGTGNQYGTAEIGDWGGDCGGFRIEPGGRSDHCTVTANQDDDADDEWFTISLNGPPGGQLRIEILDDDASGAEEEIPVALSVGQAEIDEGGWTDVTVTLGRGVLSPTTIPLTVTKDSAEEGDYRFQTAEVTIRPGERSGETGSVPLITLHDDDYDDETLTVSLGPLPPGFEAARPGRVRVTIRDDDEPPPPGPGPNAGRDTLAYWDTDGTYGLTCAEAKTARGGGLRLPAKYYVDFAACEADWAAGRYGTANCALDRTATVYAWLEEGDPYNIDTSMTVCGTDPNPGGYVPCGSLYDPDFDRQDHFGQCMENSLGSGADHLLPPRMPTPVPALPLAGVAALGLMLALRGLARRRRPGGGR